MGSSVRFIFVVVCIIVGSAISVCADDPMRFFPPELGSMHRVSLIQGEEALEKIDQLHGKPIMAEFGMIGTYTDGSKRAEIWVSGAGHTAVAAEQVRVMVEKMLGSSRSPFRNHTLINRTDPNDRTAHPVSLHRFFGMGQLHYIFNTSDLVWWISCTPDTDPALWDRFLFLTP